MPTLKFKTNINCGNCIRAVTPTLNGERAIQTWEVDTTSPDKILTVATELSAAQVEALIEKAGFEAQVAKKAFLLIKLIILIPKRNWSMM